MSLRSPTEHEKRGASLQAAAHARRGFWPSAASVMPAWIAGIQARRMRPDTSMSTWVPAVHAGTTSSYCNVYATYANLMAIVLPPQTKFSKECVMSLRSPTDHENGGFPFVARMEQSVIRVSSFTHAVASATPHATFLDSASLHPGYNSKAHPHAPYFQRSVS